MQYSVVSVHYEMKIPQMGEPACGANWAGGLGDLAGHIPGGLAKAGIDGIAFTILHPRDWKSGQAIDYENIPGMAWITDLKFDIHYCEETVPMYRIVVGGSSVYGFADPAADVLYRDKHHKRYVAARLGRMVPAALKYLGIKPDIVWTHEWPAGLVIANMANDSHFEGTKYLFTLHSPQGAALDGYSAEEFDSLAINSCFRRAFTQNGYLDPSLGVVEIADMVNGVSAEHGELCRIMYFNHRDKIVGIRNGLPREEILSPNVKTLINRYKLPSPNQLNTAHMKDKIQFAEAITDATGRELDVQRAFVGGFHRLVTYKNQKDMFERNLCHLCVERDAYVILGGVAHDKDTEARGWEDEFRRWMDDPNLKGRFVYIGREHYSDEWRTMAFRGSDIWTETPFPGKEACATSGMAAEINGNPVLGSRTGWHMECADEYDPHTGEGHSFIIDPYNHETFRVKLDQMLDLYYACHKANDETWPKLRHKTFLAGKEHDIMFMMARYKLAFEEMCEGLRLQAVA